MFEGKIVWMTGASSGIGEALSMEFMKDGAKLVLSARRGQELERVRSDLIAAGGKDEDILVLPLDVTDEAAMPDAVKAVKDHFGRIDMLFNNAGISQRSLFLDTEMVAVRKLFEVDVFGQIALTKAVLPVMLEQGEGHLAVTGSVAGKVGVKERSSYCGAKHAIIGVFDAIRAEHSSDGIKVTVVNPGFVQTAIAENAVKGDGTAFGKVDVDNASGLTAEEFATRTMKQLKKGTPEFVVAGKEETQAAWLRRIWPAMLFKKTAERGASQKQ